jgi:transcriptional regulator of nitric oxide reductase
MKHFAVALALVTSAGLITLDAQKRIVTNDAGPHLKRLFPDAAAFSTHHGDPLHYKVYGVDPRTNPAAKPLGLVFWTTDVVPDEYGYHGPIHILVGMDFAGILRGVIVDYNSEPYGYFSVAPTHFADQFKGKSIRSRFRVGDDVHEVSRATITMESATRAIRDSSRTIARAFLDPASVK